MFDRLMGVLRPIQERRAKLAASSDVDGILADGARKAAEIARATMCDVRKLVGVGTGA